MRFRNLLASATMALGMTFGGGASAATIVNLGFAIDHSGSVNNTDFALQQNGLANALGSIPTSGDVEYRVSVVTFGADVKTLVQPTIVTAANIAQIQSNITTHARSNTGATATGPAISQLTTLFSPHDMLNTLTLFNISTDGLPNFGGSPVQAASDAIAAGVDGISVELVGNFGQTQINNMLAITSPNPSVYITSAADLPNPTEKGFVFGVVDFDDYQAAISSKVQRIVVDTGGGTPNVVPLPAGMPLLLAGLGAFAFMRRRQMRAA